MESTLQAKTFLEYIQEFLLTQNQFISTPYGQRPLIYADYVASGQHLSIIESYLQQNILPYYANTHTTSSFTGAQSTLFRQQARSIIAKSINANENEYSVIFTGSGATGAIHLLTKLIGIDTYRNVKSFTKRPVIFVSIYEHHSNLLPWRESGAEIVVIPTDSSNESNGLDLNVLERCLKQYQYRPLKIASFTAASNVTGILMNVDIISSLVKSYGFQIFWDYACAGPYQKIDMNPPILPNASYKNKISPSKDAIFLSPHKFIGGPGSPGILVVRNSILNQTHTMKKQTFIQKISQKLHLGQPEAVVPVIPSGGTVTYVTSKHQKYTTDGIEREEGGTPNIIGAIRAALSFEILNQIGYDVILKKEHELTERAMKRWKECPNLCILGDLEASRLPIFSFLIRHQELFLHPAFVARLLNDLFGIQTRSGCACAGPYGIQILNITENMELSQLLDDGYSLYKPGYTRLNLSYMMKEETIEYILKSVEIIAQHGWKFLPFYQYDIKSGEWNHRLMPLETQLHSLDFKSFLNENLNQIKEKKDIKTNSLNEIISHTLELIKDIERNQEWNENEVNSIDEIILYNSIHYKYCYFMLPSEARKELKYQKTTPLINKRTSYFELPSASIWRSPKMEEVAIFENSRAKEIPIVVCKLKHQHNNLKAGLNHWKHHLIQVK